MKVLAALCVTLTFSYSMFIVDVSESEDTSIDRYETGAEQVAQCGGHCHCCPHYCWCIAGLVSFSIEMVKTESGKHPQVLATFQVLGVYFDNKFDVNKTETYCMRIRYTKYCFEFDVKEPTKMEYVPTCVKLTEFKSKPKPHTKEVDFGCVNVPLRTTGNNVIDDEKEYGLFFE